MRGEIKDVDASRHMLASLKRTGFDAILISGNADFYRNYAPVDEASWRAPPWSEPFFDIEGEIRPNPTLLTRVNLLWDDEYLNVGADLTEPHVW